MRTAPHHYSMQILWSDEDQAYLVTLPEWTDRVMQPVTHGANYEEAAKNGQEVLVMLIEAAQQEGRPLPLPMVFVSQGTAS
jgi:antitoxin HicB